MVIFITIAAITCLFFLFVIKYDHFRDFFSPQILLTLFFIFFYIIPAFQFIQGSDYFTKTIGMFFVSSPLTEIDRLNAIVVSFISFVCLISGIYFSYWVKVSRINPKISVKSEIFWNRMNLDLVIFLYFIAGILETLLLVRVYRRALLSNLGEKFGILTGNYVFTFGWMFLSVVAILILFQKKKITKIFILLLIASILSAALLISRGFTLIIVGSVIIIYNYYIKPINLKWILLIGILGILGAVFYKVAQVLIISHFNLHYLSLEYIFIALKHDLFGDVLIGPQQLSFALKGIPSILDFQYGKTIIGFLISLIPRSIFTEKPMVSGAGLFTQSLFPYIFNIGTTIPPGFISELYMNFSIVGLMVGMLLCGLFLGHLYQIMKFKKSVFLVFLYSFCIVSFLYLLRGEFLLVTKYIIFVAFFWIALRFSSKEKIILVKKDLN